MPLASHIQCIKDDTVPINDKMSKGFPVYIGESKTGLLSLGIQHYDQCSKVVVCCLGWFHIWTRWLHHTSNVIFADNESYAYEIMLDIKTPAYLYQYWQDQGIHNQWLPDNHTLWWSSLEQFTYFGWFSQEYKIVATDNVSNQTGQAALAFRKVFLEKKQHKDCCWNILLSIINDQCTRSWTLLQIDLKKVKVF